MPITFVASSTDPQNSEITYAWSFGDGATDSGAQVVHTFENEGSYTVRVTATSALQLSSSAEVLILIEYQPPAATIFPAEAGVILGQFVRLEVAATDPNGLALTYSWDFGDGGVGLGDIADHRYTALGEYAPVVTVTNSAGQSRTATARVEVHAPSAQPALIDDEFSVYCSGAYCGALDASTYSGSGFGIWRYHNSTASDATIDVKIDGVQGAKRTTLVFSNGESVAASGVPSAGSSAAALSQIPASTKLSGSEPPVHDAHFAIVEENQRIARGVARLSGGIKNDTSLRIRKGAVRRKPAPALGTTRAWNVFLSDPYEHTMAVAATCPLSDGRNAVFWVDAASYSEEQISATKLNRLADSFCGSEGSYAQLVALVGDVWGPEAQSNPNLIQDSPEELQDFHVVLPYVSQATSWGGFFASGNLWSKTFNADSNEALAVFLNGRFFAHAPDEDRTQVSQLVHELKHHINFYQRSVRHGAVHDPWLEETSAMMAEDILSPSVGGDRRTLARMDGYATSGGGIGYVDWTHPDGQSYNQGGTFAGFLNRHFGLGIHRDLVEECRDGGAGSTSYECVDDLIRKYGGHGFADAFARMGATTFAQIPKVSSPLGFGLPGVEHDGRFLDPIDFVSLLRHPPRDLAGTFLATSHTYHDDVISEGQTSYVRTDVVVPGKTTLTLVIQ